MRPCLINQNMGLARQFSIPIPNSRRASGMHPLAENRPGDGITHAIEFLIIPVNSA
jgi:hypothetical protein